MKNMSTRSMGRSMRDMRNISRTHRAGVDHACVVGMMGMVGVHVCMVGLQASRHSGHASMRACGHAWAVQLGGVHGWDT